MHDLENAWTALQFGGVMIYPLLFLAVLTVAILLDKTFVYWRYTRLHGRLVRLVDQGAPGWTELQRRVDLLSRRHYFTRFLRAILEHREAPVWWIESRAADEARHLERAAGRGLWVLETVVTAAPLMGLLGTITGMMDAFDLIGSKGLVDPQGVTSGVAQALIATALGLLIALVALFGFNLFARLQAQTLDEMERVGSRLVDRIRLDGQGKEVQDEAA